MYSCSFECQQGERCCGLEHILIGELLDSERFDRLLACKDSMLIEDEGAIHIIVGNRSTPVLQSPKRSEHTSLPVAVLKMVSKVLLMVSSVSPFSSRFTRKSLSTRIW